MFILIAKESCFDIKIRKGISVDNAKRLIVRGETVDRDYKFEDSKQFLVKKVGDLTFIETDKPIYKPGQKGKIARDSFSSYNLEFNS